jgi:AbrB family looped-hinge helix DNA binding protein
MDYHLTKGKAQRKVSEAAVEYIAGSRRDDVMTTISSKNQITLPAHLLRELGIGPGDRLAITRDGGRLVLRARPRDWVGYHAGSLAYLYGKTAEEADAYVKELRADDVRAEAIERAWQRPGPAPE